MLKAKGLSKTYTTTEGKNIVLNRLDFCGGSGELCMICGKSGCGKSTLLNVLSCLDGFDSGVLKICGKNTADMNHKDICSLRRKEIAFVFQDYNLISSLTARQNVELGLKYRGIKKEKRQIMTEKVLNQVGLLGREDYMPNQLSGGQQQRVALARAIVLSPKILFCDEPTGNLDAESTKLVMDKILEIKNKGALVIMITHDESLLCLADRVLILENGKLWEKCPNKNTSADKQKFA